MLRKRPLEADLSYVSSPSAPSARALDESLSRLPPDVGIAHRGWDRLVTGMGGAFVLHPLDPDETPREAVEHAHRLAEATRHRIAQHLAWVPFVDWFVVDDDPDHVIPVLPSTMVEATVLEGHAISRSIVDELHRHIAIGSLAPLWHDGLPVTDNDLAEVMTHMRPLG